MNPFTFIRDKFNKPQMPTIKIFVSNVSFTSNKSGHTDLQALFQKAGEVLKFTMVNDRETGKFKGFGFVEMSENDGRKAIQKLDNHDFHGRKLVVREANPKNG
jgi:RNA recognition motif-containing protein